jgi:hypothetical protein
VGTRYKAADRGQPLTTTADELCDAVAGFAKAGLSCWRVKPGEKKPTDLGWPHRDLRTRRRWGAPGDRHRPAQFPASEVSPLLNREKKP